MNSRGSSFFPLHLSSSLADWKKWLPYAGAAAGFFLLVMGFLSRRLWYSDWLVLLAGMLLSFCAVELLLRADVSPAWSYRGAFLLGAAAASLDWIAAFASSGVNPGTRLLFVGWFGAILGAMLATAQREGICENNFPPSAEVEAEVLAIHRQVIGRPAPLPISKRIFDLVLSDLGLILSFPFVFFFSALIWLEDPGPVIFMKNSVGRGGINFHEYKLRTMVREAEKATGPTLATEEDTRVLWVGMFLRKTALDELPQLVNILKGEMSFVGPRPQRTVLVHGYLQEMPEYAERHRVPPGLAGLAQVIGSYYMSPEEKLSWDRRYLEHANLGFDLKLLALAVVLVLVLRWGKNESLPRRWLGLG
ncbi:MAG: sugar transferase [Anaerolineaceae bacterium]